MLFRRPILSCGMAYRDASGHTVVRPELAPRSSNACALPPNLTTYKQAVQILRSLSSSTSSGRGRISPFARLSKRPPPLPHPPSRRPPAEGDGMVACLHTSLGRRECLDSAHRRLAQAQHGHQQRVQARLDERPVHRVRQVEHHPPLLQGNLPPAGGDRRQLLQ